MLLASNNWRNCSVIIPVLSARPKSKNALPATASSRQSPPVTPAAHASARSSLWRGISPRQQPHECQRSQQRHGPLDDDERHRDGAELVIAGQQCR